MVQSVGQLLLIGDRKGPRHQLLVAKLLMQQPLVEAECQGSSRRTAEWHRQLVAEFCNRLQFGVGIDQAELDLVLIDELAEALTITLLIAAREQDDLVTVLLGKLFTPPHDEANERLPGRSRNRRR